MKIQFLSPREAVNMIPNGACIATGGFCTVGVPEEIETAMEEKYLQDGSPNNLTLYYAAGQGSGKDGGVNHLAHDGMVKRVVGGHWNLAPALQKMAMEDKIEAYNLPQGVISHMFRDAASGKELTISRVGLDTFVDPDLEGGKLNARTTEEIVKKTVLEGKEYLIYTPPKLDVAILRGTYADENGNVTLEEEGATLEATSIALAAKNNGGIVIVQVKDIVQAGSLDPRLVKLSSAMVDVIVKTTDVEKYHQQTFGTTFLPWFSGQKRAVLKETEALEMSNRKIIGRRCAMMMRQDMIVNLGIGMPEAVATVLNEEGHGNSMMLTVESGPQGGVPAAGSLFGQSYNPDIILDQDRQFDFYDGGGLDITILGLAQCDKKGNINVSKFGPRIAGCGGFINISQNTHTVVFCGTFTAGGLKEAVRDGKLVILQEGKTKKFVKEIEQITFSSVYAEKENQDVTYITERCVFKLEQGRLVLTEIAPGIDLKRDILDQMEFEPMMKDLKLMDERIFREKKMNLVLQGEG